MSNAPPPTTPPPETGMGRVRAFRTRHPQALAIAFFAAGFTFDAFMVQRIDDLPMLIQQGVYLLLVGILLAIAERTELLKLPAPWILRPVWKWSDHALHFMLGTLLNAYMLFYVKSASGVTALLFFAVISGLLAINEMPRFHRFGPVVLMGLYSFCLTSYFAYVIPVLVGRLRSWMFYAAVAIAFLPLSALIRGIRNWSGSVRTTVRHAAAPALGVQLLLVFLFTFGLVPPVPLSVRAIGIYHSVEREPGGGEFLLGHEPNGWHFWRKDDRVFRARPGDRIFCYVQIFAPRSFRDRVRVRWMYQDPLHGWTSSDAVAMTITGGREEGFRGFSYKSHFTPGSWRVAVETEDEREIGAMRFSVETDSETSPRELVIERG